MLPQLPGRLKPRRVLYARGPAAQAAGGRHLGAGSASAILGGATGRRRGAGRTSPGRAGGPPRCRAGTLLLEGSAPRLGLVPLSCL